jgi:putative membrane protein
VPRWGKLSGAAFDKAYMQGMVGDHDHAVTMFKTFSERGDDPELKQWAEKTLPTLEDHERLAKTTATKVRTAKGMSSSGGASTTIHASDKGTSGGPVRTTQKGTEK